MKHSHDTRLQARIVLAEEGYIVAFSSPGRPELWVKLSDSDRRCAIARVVEGADETWRIVAYPEPAVCGADEMPALLNRDGQVLQAGRLCETMPSVDDSWLD
jgi:hypothetical protein